MKRTITTLILASVACAAFALMSCSHPTQSTGNGSGIGNGVVVAMLYNQNGTPAVGVRVFIRPKKSLADTSGTGLPKRLAILAETDSVFTDTNGRYAFDTTLDTGTYVIEAASGNNAVLIDSVAVKSKAATDTLPPDTLKPAGAIKGVIKLSEGGDPRKVFVLAFGIDRFAKVNVDGSFKFSGLARGTYDLRLISSLNNYGVLDTVNISVKSSDTTDLDTIELPFTGIPTPKNLNVSYDTLTQTVILKWDAADTSLIDGYNIYRAIKGQNFSLLTQTPLPETATIYHDSNVTIGNTYEYRLVSRKASGEESPKVDIAGDTAIAVSKSLVITSFTWKLGNTLNDTASIYDTVTFMLHYSNPTRKIRTIAWYIDSVSAGAPFRQTSDSALSGADTIRYSWKQAGIKHVYVKASDAAGTVWTDSISVVNIQDIPEASISGNSTVPINTPITFTAGVSQKFGRIVKYKWDNGIAPGWDDSTGAVYTVTYSSETTVTVKVEVTDDDGNSNMASKTIVITNDAPVITGMKDTTISINDVVVFSISVTDSNGILQRYYWNFGDGSSKQYDTTNATTISHKYPSSPMRCVTTVTVADSFGKTSVKSAVINVILDPPVANAGNDTTVGSGDTVHLRGSKSADKYGHIVKYEWDILNVGAFVTCSTGDTDFVAPDTFFSSFKSILRVTDDDGCIGFDTMLARVGYFNMADNSGASGRRNYHTSLSFAGKLWMIGGNGTFDVRYSTNGTEWTVATNSPPFHERWGHTSVVFDSKMWVIGGWAIINENGQLTNDLWYSQNGVDWIQATDSASFSVRMDHTSVVFDNKMWVIGGRNTMTEQSYNDVWYSQDGVNWIQATASANFSARDNHCSVVYDNKMWVIGGYDWNSGRMNDIWNSADGISWSLVNSSSAFSARYESGVEVFSGKIWLIGGSTATQYKNDVWNTTDGLHWQIATSNAEFNGITGHSCTVFNGRLWLLGGYSVGGLTSEVWYLR
jgi:hypothetical protein